MTVQGISEDTAELFKQAFGNHPAGVSILTATTDAGEPVGMTASSLVSVSADPAIVAFSLKSLSGTAAVISEADSFLIHMLNADNIALAKTFAKPGLPRFENPEEWEKLSTGEPLLHGVGVVARAVPLSRVAAGPALVVTARIEEFIRHNTDGAPLVYHSRTFHTLGEHSSVEYMI